MWAVRNECNLVGHGEEDAEHAALSISIIIAEQAALMRSGRENKNHKYG
jgi:hypothetical protein